MTPRKSIRTLGLSVAMLAAVTALPAGCASSSGPQVLAIGSEQYAAAFDASVETARRHRMPSVLRDRRGGIIETEPAIAGSILEPWKGGNASVKQALDHTVNFERRRARFEFVPSGVAPSRSAASSSGPDLIGLGRADDDLTAHPGPLELRVTVVVERAYDPTLRHDDWTLIKTSNSPIVPANDQMPTISSGYWTAIGRDAAMERRLLEEIRLTLATPPIGP